VCGDSHTASTARSVASRSASARRVGHVSRLSAFCSAARRRWPSTSTPFAAGTTAKDLILAIIGKIGVSGGTGHVIEYRRPASRRISMDERMTVCNMSIEAGARAGMVAPDETTFAYLNAVASRRKASIGNVALPTGAACAPIRARASIAKSRSTPATLEPMVTYGTHPGMVAPITGTVPLTAMSRLR